MKITGRSKSLDTLKSICAFLVVCIHVPFPGTIGSYITVLSRIAVPLFFMITGYFYSEVVKRGGESRQIKKILQLFIEANLIYFLWKLFLAVMSSDLRDFLQDMFSVKTLFKFLFLNESPFSGHLWYLGAILYVLIVVLITGKLHCERLLYILTPALLLGDLILGKYSLVLWNREFPYILVRNFVFVGIPYFCIGRLIKNGFGKNIDRKMLSALVLIFSFTSLLERFVLVSFNVNSARDHYVSTTLLAVAVFLFALSYEIEEDNITSRKLPRGGYQLNNLMTVIGRKYSTWIYIFHPIFITCIGVIVSKIGLYGIYKYIAPIVVYISTVMFLVIVGRAKKLLNVGHS